MANFSALKQSIQNYIKQNGNKEITGNLLQTILLSMVTTMGDGAINGNASDISDIKGDIQNIDGLLNAITTRLNAGAVYAGYATPSTTPAALTSQKVFYLATQAGTYTHFHFNGGNDPIVLTKDGIYFIVSGDDDDDWNAEPILMFDDVPTASSTNAVKSGGVAEELALGAVYDVSAKNPTAGHNSDGKWESLSELLSDANLNTIIPTSVRKGGMSIKFVQTSDNKYVQFRLMAQSFTTDVTKWQSSDLTQQAGCIINWGDCYNLKIRNMIQELSLYVTNKNVLGNILALSQAFYLEQYNNLYIVIKDLTNNGAYLGTYTAQIPSDDFSGVKTLYFVEAGSDTEDADSFIYARINCDEYVNFRNVSDDVTPRVFPIFCDKIELDDKPIKNSTKLPLSGGTYTQIVDSIPPNGVVSWGDYAGIPMTKSLKELKLLTTNKDFISHKIVIEQYAYFAENKVTIVFWDDTTGHRFGAYNIDLTGIDVTIDRTFDIQEAASDTEDLYSHVILTANFSELTSPYDNRNAGSPGIVRPRIVVNFDEDCEVKNVKSASSHHGVFAGISSIRCYVPDPSVNYRISMLGYNTKYERFYFRLYNLDTNQESAYQAKQYAQMPTSGKETICMILSVECGNAFFYVEIDIDWSKYSSGGGTFISNTGKVINTFSTKDLIYLQGEIAVDLTNVIINIPANINLYGKNCVIKANGRGGFKLYSNSSFNNIVFESISSDKIVREEYTPAEIEEKPARQYTYKPIVTLQDLSAETNETFYGNSSNATPFIEIAPTAINAGINGCTFRYFNQAVILDGNFTNRHTSPEHSYIVNSMFDRCRTGLCVREEFTRIIGNYFYGCIIGIIVKGSNFNAVNNMFVRNDAGMHFSTGNNAHGEVSTLEFAHQGVAGIYAKTINNQVGFIFTNCQFAQAPIIAETAYALKLSSCRIDTHIIISNGAKNSIVNNNCRYAYAQDEGIPIEDMFDVPEDTLITLNRNMVSGGSDDPFNRS